MIAIRRGFSGLGLAITLRLLAFLPALVTYGQPPPQVADQQKPPAYVTLENQPLFPINTKLGPFSPEDRAKAASKKLEHLSKDVLTDPNSIALDEHEDSTDMVAGDVIITTITDQDAKAAGTQRSALASDRVTRARAAVSRVRGEYTYKSLLLGALYATLTTLALISLLIALRRFSPRLYAAIEQWQDTRLRTLRIQSVELLSEARITELLVHFARFVRFGITLLLFYFYIPLMFSFFPWTRSYGAKLLGYVLSPIAKSWAAFISYLPSLLFVFVIAWFAYFAIRAARFILKEVERGTIHWPGFYPEWAMPTFKIIRILILAFALVIMFPYLPGSESPAFKGVSIFLGVLFSLGSSSAVANIVAGVILTYTRAFRIGDRVQVADTVGDVIEKTLLATRVRTIKNAFITIPNSLVLGSHIINFSASAQGQGLILNTGVTIGYDAPWRQVHELLMGAAAVTPGVLKEPKPFVLQKSLDDFYVSYEINAYTDQPERMSAIYSHLHQNIQDRFNEAGVEIMSPHYNAVRDGNATAIPESYLPAGYEPPAFRVAPSGRHSKAAGARGANAE